jgi:hypothetical protein
LGVATAEDFVAAMKEAKAMNRLILLLACALAVSCSTTRQLAANRVLRKVDAVLCRERTGAGFERRLDALGAKIEAGTNPGERVASFPAPGGPGDPIPTTRPLPGYFPPRIVRVVYSVDTDGVVILQSADVVSLGSLFGNKQANYNAPAPRILLVPPPADPREALVRVAADL